MTTVEGELGYNPFSHLDYKMKIGEGFNQHVTVEADNSSYRRRVAERFGCKNEFVKVKRQKVEKYEVKPQKVKSQAQNESQKSTC